MEALLEGRAEAVVGFCHVAEAVGRGWVSWDVLLVGWLFFWARRGMREVKGWEDWEKGESGVLQRIAAGCGPVEEV